jgi:hypothetical protein
MPPKLRVEVPGAIYHVLSRGDRREDIFRDDVDRQDFLKTVCDYVQLNPVRVRGDFMFPGFLDRSGKLHANGRS